MSISETPNAVLLDQVYEGDKCFILNDVSGMCDSLFSPGVEMRGIFVL